MNKQQLKIIGLSCLGGALEFYDFIIFVFFAKFIGELFFPVTDPTARLLATFAVFAMGYIARPLGGMLFGHLGDTTGRKKTFSVTVAIMAASTFAMGLLPTYQQVGWLAPVLMTVLRLLQGFSLGGEIPGAITFAVESVPQDRRGLAAGIIFAGINGGLLLGSAASTLTVSLLSDAQLITWGWRIPFLFGGVLGIVSYYLRKKMQETPIFIRQKKNLLGSTLPLVEVVKTYPTNLLRGGVLAGLGAVAINLPFLFMPTYLAVYFHFPLEKTLMLNTCNIALLSLTIIAVGHFSDRYGRKKFLLSGAGGLVVLAVPLFLLFSIGSFMWAALATMILSLIVGLYVGCYPCTIAELFPTPIRYSGYAISYNIGFAIFGGLTPLVATYLIKLTSHLIAPSYFLLVCAALGLMIVLQLRETYRDVW